MNPKAKPFEIRSSSGGGGTNTHNKNNKNNKNSNSHKSNNSKSNIESKKIDPKSFPAIGEKSSSTHQIPKESPTPQAKKELSSTPQIAKQGSSIEDLIENYVNSPDENLIPEILEAHENAGYKWVPMCQFCPKAFYQFLKNGNLGDTNFLIDLPHIMTNSIADEPDYSKVPWDAFIVALSKFNKDIDRELYIPKVGNVSKLLDLHKLDFVDHRLEHGITLIQRLIRIGPFCSSEAKRTNLDNKTPDRPEGWLDKFMEENHKPEEHWKDHQIHLKSIRDIKQGLPDNAEDSVMYYNRQLIPEYLFDYYLKSKGKGYDIKVYCDVDNLIGEKFSASKLYDDKRDKIVELLQNVTSADDSYKLCILIVSYFANGFNLWRNIRIDGLKFVVIRNEDRTDSISTDQRKHLIEQMMMYNYSILIIIFEKLKECKFKYGLRLMDDFMNLNIGRLSLKEIKAWYLLMIVGDISDNKFKHNLKDFLSDTECENLFKHEEDMVRYLKDQLLACQNKIRVKAPIVNPADVMSYTKPQINAVIMKDENY